MITQVLLGSHLQVWMTLVLFANPLISLFFSVSVCALGVYSSFQIVFARRPWLTNVLRFGLAT